MLALSRKNMALLILVALVVTLVASMSIIHAINPALWQHFLSVGPDVISHW